eukprot:5667305-Prymnesium_polylepis.1
MNLQATCTNTPTTSPSGHVSYFMLMPRRPNEFRHHRNRRGNRNKFMSEKDALIGRLRGLAHWGSTTSSTLLAGTSPTKNTNVRRACVGPPRVRYGPRRRARTRQRTESETRAGSSSEDGKGRLWGACAARAIRHPTSLNVRAHSPPGRPRLDGG